MSIEVHDSSGELSKLGVKMVKAKRRKDGNVSLLGVTDENAPATTEPKESNDETPRVSFTKDPKTGAIIFSNGQRIEQEEIAPSEERAAKAEAESIMAEAVEVRQSALDFVAGLQTKKTANIQVVTSSGIEFWHRPFSGLEVMSLGMMLYRDGDAVNVDGGFDKSKLPDLMAKVLYSFLVKGADSEEKLFDSEDAAKRFCYHPDVKTEAIEVTTAIMSSVPNFMSLLSAA